MEQNVLTYDSREWEREEMGIVAGNVMGMGMAQQNKWYREWDWEWLHGNGREWDSERHSRSPLLSTYNPLGTMLAHTCRVRFTIISQDFANAVTASVATVNPTRIFD